MRPGQHPQTRVAQPDPQPTPPADTPPPPPPTDTPPPPPPTTTTTTTTTTPPPATVPATPNLSDEELARMAEQDASKKEGEIIVVTGSAIERKELTTPSPVSVVDREKLESAGISNVGDILQKIPSQGNAINAQNNNGGDGSTRIDLRSLGSARTLVLLNGRRMVAGGLGADSSPDIGSIPLAVIERVEVLKDGASAVYGSDAIAGVVNIITRNDFEGTEATVYTGTSQHNDGLNYDLSIVTGHSSKKGNVMFAASYTEQRAVMAGARDFSKQTYTFDYTTGMATLSGSSSPPGGRITAKDANGDPIHIPGCSNSDMGGKCIANTNAQGIGDGTFRNFAPPTDTSFGDNYNFQPENYLFTPSQKVNLFSTGHYELAKGVNVFYEASYNNRRSTQQLAAEPLTTELFGTPISKDSMYNPLGADIGTYHRRLVEFGDRTFNQDINTYRTVVGVEGHIPDDVDFFHNWKWEVSFNAGRTNATQSTSGDLILSHLANALGPSMDVGGTPTCVSTPGDATSAIPGCVPLNLLSPGHVTGDMVKYLTFTGVQSGFNEQRTTIASISGQLVKLPNGGDISLAIGGDYRHEQGGQVPDPLTATGDTTGNAIQPTEGSYKAFEGFGELSIVPVSGLEFAQWVELDLAARAYHYDNFGSGATYKASGLFRTAGGLSLRGTYGTAFRAPNVAELYSGKADSFPLVQDPCDTNPSTGPRTLDANTAKECAKEGVPANASFGTDQQRSQVGGNKNLQPETAKIATAGIVYEPLAGLAVTLDYWNIEIDNQITSLPVATILSQCYENGNQDYCDPSRKGIGITRASDGSISYIFDPTANNGNLKTSGLDFSVGYSWKSPGAGRFRHALEGTYLFKYNLDTGGQIADANGKLVEQIIHGKGNYDLGVQPALKVNLLTSWVHPSGFGAGFNIRYVNSFKECDQDNCNTDVQFDEGKAVGFSRDVSSYITGDIFLDYMVKSSQGTTKISAGVNNVGDATPPVIYNGAALNADESAYDFMGRYFYVRLSQLF